MFLNISVDGTTFDIDLNGLVDLEWVWDESALCEALLMRVALRAIKEGIGFDEVIPLSIESESGDELEISHESGWLDEVAKLIWFVHELPSWDSGGKYFAAVVNQGWAWFSFDELSSVDDDFHSEFDGDYEQFAIDWLENSGDSIPDELERYFDFHDLGVDKVDEYKSADWDGVTYLFCQ